MKYIDEEQRIFKMPVVAARGRVAFPKCMLNIDVARRESLEAIDRAMENDGLIFLVAQKNNAIEKPKQEHLFSVGTVVRIKNIIRLTNGISRISVEGVERAAVVGVEFNGSYLEGNGMILMPSFNGDVARREALVRLLNDAFDKYALETKAFPMEFIVEVTSTEELGLLTDTIVNRLSLEHTEKQEYLGELHIIDRATRLLAYLNNENSVYDVKREISEKVKANIDKNQREFILREQLKVISEELGDDGVGAEIKAYREKAEKLNMPEYAAEKLEKEFKRLERMPVTSAEGSVARDYIETVLSLPWNKLGKENQDLIKAEKILNKDHYGLEKVKERIIEYLAVRNKNGGKGALVICLVGPPGVGKTSVAKSVARALNREYVRMSLGGLHDESEIRGHRRTYIGAMPGRIITSVAQAGTDNPLILLDEIDKLGNDYKGDPTSALLEVLDGEQNVNFRDNYLEMSYDISRVLFMCTANTLDTIPAPLRDRLEIIELSGYTPMEKLQIAKNYIIPKQLNNNGLKKSELKFKTEAVSELIQSYTREAGVRQLERCIGNVCRKAVKNQLEDTKSVTVTLKNISDFLGKKKYKTDLVNKADQVGICRGLAWTSVGGDTLSIEVNVMPGKGKRVITGNVGKVMEESFGAAISFIRANAVELGIDVNFEEIDIHTHIPEGAVPKDGPSAGVTMTTAIVSALTGIPVYANVAMTGEISIRGRVMPIGGLKEKVLAAGRAGVTRIILPIDNGADLDEIPDYAKENIEFVLVENISQVLENALNFNIRDNTQKNVNVGMLLNNRPVHYARGERNECK